METNRFGLSLDERGYLTPDTEDGRKLNVTFSLLTFVSVLFLCTLIVTALMIVRPQKSGSSNMEKKDMRDTTGEVPHAEELGEATASSIERSATASRTWANKFLEQYAFVHAPTRADVISHALPDATKN
jgi:hypothetical protein